MENGRTLEGILLDLENENYTPEIYNIPACGVGAWHKRERIWIVCRRKQIDTDSGLQRQAKHEKQTTGIKQHGEPIANSIKFNDDKPGYGTSSICGIGQKEAEIQRCEDATNTTKSGLQNRGGTSVGRSKKESKFKRPSFNQRIWQFEPNVDRVANGIPGRVDRLKGLGNAIVPQVAFEIFKAIVDFENKTI